jgi:PAS domain S-box-containing protein
MSKSFAEAQPPLSERLPIVTYTNTFRETAETIWMSPQVQRLFGYRLEEWVGNPGFFETVVLHPEDRGPVLAEMRASREDLRPFSRDYRMRSRDGRTVWVHDESVPIVGEDGRSSSRATSSTSPSGKSSNGTSCRPRRPRRSAAWLPGSRTTSTTC